MNYKDFVERVKFCPAVINYSFLDYFILCLKEIEYRQFTVNPSEFEKIKLKSLKGVEAVFDSYNTPISTIDIITREEVILNSAGAIIKHNEQLSNNLKHALYKKGNCLSAIEDIFDYGIYTSSHNIKMDTKLFIKEIDNIFDYLTNLQFCTSTYLELDNEVLKYEATTLTTYNCDIAFIASSLSGTEQRLVQYSPLLVWIVGKIANNWSKLIMNDPIFLKFEFPSEFNFMNFQSYHYPENILDPFNPYAWLGNQVRISWLISAALEECKNCFWANEPLPTRVRKLEFSLCDMANYRDFIDIPYLYFDV